MKTNELRIGNWVKVYGAMKQVFSIDHDAINGSFYGDSSCPYIIECTPIPLTIEILEKAGFRFADHLSTKTRFSKSNFHINFSKKKWYLHGYRGYPIGLQYLHQLQNLYFALTGEELNIEP